MKTDKKEKWAIAAALVMGSMVIQTGCVRQTDIPIVSEKTEETKGGGEAEAEKQGGNEEGERKQGEKQQEGREQAGLIREQAEVPERYQISIEEEDITITADVRVEVPETESICLKDVEYSPYSDQELEQIRDILEEELGSRVQADGSQNIQVSGDGKDSESSFHIYATSEGLTYTLDLRAGDSQNMPVIWLSATDVSDGTGGDKDPDDLSGCPMTEAEMGRLQAVLENKAEQLLQKMNLNDFRLESARWRQISVSENYSWTLSGQYGVRLYYGRRIGELPLVNSQQRQGSLKPRSQYVEFLYREDGTLLTVKNIGRERIMDTSEHTGFLLPFSSVSQVFEQCMRSANVHGNTETQVMEEVELRPEEARVLNKQYAGKKPHIYLEVTGVKLAYGLEYDDRVEDMPQTNGKKGSWSRYGPFTGQWNRGIRTLTEPRPRSLGPSQTGGWKHCF
ncbi:MAG: hypothetical protein HFG75_05930 [Hungatella sp.]|nr:hypothetical protein [Hungatella sp.]